MNEEKKFEDLTADELKEFKIEFAPGCFDGFEGSQEELDEFVAHLKKMILSGEAAKNSRELTEEDFDKLPIEIQEQISNTLEGIDSRKKLQ